MNQQEHKIKRFCMAVLAHVDAGKTTLSEGLLYTGGSIRKVGRVDNKDAYFDNFELERTRGITIFSKHVRAFALSLKIFKKCTVQARHFFPLLTGTAFLKGTKVCGKLM